MDTAGSTLKVVIADDEPLARQLLVRLIRNQPGIEIAGVAEDGESTRRLIDRTKADLVFLDIEMPKISGVDLVAELRTAAERPYVVFVTAYDHYASKAFDLEAVDYLVKPIRKHRLERSIERARQAATAAKVRQADSRHVLIRHGDELLRLPESDIYWLEAASQYVRVHTRDERYIVAEPLNKYHAKLSSDAFVRVHRSAVVNVNKVKRVLRRMNGVHELRLSNGVGVPLSRSRKVMVDDFLDLSAQNRAQA